MNRIARVASLAACLLGAAVPVARAGAQAVGPQTVAIAFPDHKAVAADTRDWEGLSKAISALLELELASSPGVRVIGRDKVQALVGTVPMDRATAVRIGAMVGAQHTIYGGFSADEAGNLRVDARAVNVTSGAMEHIDRLQDRDDNIMPLVHRLAARLAAGLHLPATSAASPLGAQSLPMRAVLLYGRALALADRGDRAGAAELFNALLTDFPDFAPAKAGLSGPR